MQQTNFDKAYAVVMGIEGKYTNDPDDGGGETYKGISRKYNPSWVGWSVIDNMKGDKQFPDVLNTLENLQVMVKNFYKEKIWDAFLGDHINNYDIALELFDTGVNMNVVRAVTFLQTSLNVLNRNGESGWYSDLVDDGHIGDNTLNALNFYLKKDDPSILLKTMNVLQGMHYIEYCKKSPKQEKFFRGWMTRVNISKG